MDQRAMLIAEIDEEGGVAWLWRADHGKRPKPVKDAASCLREIDGLTLTQSLAIVEYLDETRQAGFLPDDAPGRARARALAYAVAMEIHPVCNLRVAGHAVTASQGAITMEGWMRAFIEPGLDAFEVMLDHPGSGRFCHGDTPGIADICLVPQLYNADRWGVSLDAMPRIRAIRSELDAVPAIAAAHPNRHAPVNAG